MITNVTAKWRKFTEWAVPGLPARHSSEPEAATGDGRPAIAPDASAGEAVARAAAADAPAAAAAGDARLADAAGSPAYQTLMVSAAGF